MTARAPEVEIRDYLAGLPGAPFGAADVNIRCGFPRSPSQPETSLVGIWIDASERGPEQHYGLAVKRYPADIDVKVISAPDDLDGGWAMARAVRDALDAKLLPDGLSVLSTLLRYLGTNEQEQHIHGVNFVATWST